MNMKNLILFLAIATTLVIATMLLTPSSLAFAQFFYTPAGQDHYTLSTPSNATTTNNATSTNTTTTTNNATSANATKIPVYNGTKGYDTPPEEPLFQSGDSSGYAEISPYHIDSQQPEETTTTPTAPTTPSGGIEASILSAEQKQEMAATDPYFAKFLQVSDLCSNAMYGEATMTAGQCVSSMQEAADRYCGLEFFDSLKCQYTSNLVRAFQNLDDVLNRYGFDTIPDSNSLLG